ncbi:MAG: tetratricopeptide repeat protein [Terriglobales bacterium]
MLRNLTERVLPLPSILIILAIWLCTTSFSQAQKSAVPAKSSSALFTAKFQLDHGDLEAGEKTLWDILSSDPANEDALTMLGIVRARQTRYAESEALFRRVLQLNPKSVVASRNLAETLLIEDKQDEAVEQFKQTMQLAPQDLGLKIKVAELDLARGNFAGALSTINTIKSDRLPPSVVPLKAASLLGMGRRSDAERLLPLVRRSPKSAVELAQVFDEAKDPDAALRSLAFVDPPAKALAARTYYLRGRAFRQKEETAAAMTNFRRSLATDPKSVETMSAMAEILASENKHADSLAILEKARVLNPDSTDILRHVIMEAMRAGENDKGLEAAQNLLRESSALDDRYLAASVMLQQRQYLPASHLFEDYVAQRPQDAKAYLGLGMAYLNLLRYADARHALEHSLQLAPDLAEAEYQLGVLFAQQGRRQEATQYWEKAVELQPHHAQALFSLGTIYLEEGELEKARNSFVQSLAADPGNMKTEYDLALVLNKLGRSEEAREHFDRYRKMEDQEHITSGNAPDTTEHP